MYCRNIQRSVSVTSIGMHVSYPYFRVLLKARCQYTQVGTVVLLGEGDFIFWYIFLPLSVSESMCPCVVWVLRVPCVGCVKCVCVYILSSLPQGKGKCLLSPSLIKISMYVAYIYTFFIAKSCFCKV